MLPKSNFTSCSPAGSPSRAWFHSKLSPRKDSSESFDPQRQSRIHWDEFLVWDLDSVQKLRELILVWVQTNISASHIGEFLKQVLYRRDEHLDHRLTKMVNCGASHADIARNIMQYYQIRDQNDKPLWVETNLQSPISTSISADTENRNTGHEKRWSPNQAPYYPGNFF